MVNEVLKISDITSNPNFNEKKEKPTNKFKAIVKKYFKVILLAILMLVGVVAYFTLTSKPNTKVSASKTISNKYITTMEYCDDLEQKLTKVLSRVKGAGNVSVMITLDGSPEIKYASDEDSRTSSNSGSTTTTSSSTPIIVNSGGESTPLITSESLPEVKGVIVVSSGASDISIKLDILNAVSTLLDISREKVIVLKGI